MRTALFAQASEKLKVRAHIARGTLSEDGHEVFRYGERTLSTYRKLAADQLGPACPTGLVPPSSELIGLVTAEWLAEFERAQWILRLSPRLRQKYGD